MNALHNRMIILSVLLMVSGCATPIVEQERTGFISDYSRLEVSSKTSYAATSDELSNFSNFIVDRPELVLREEHVAESSFTEEELNELVSYAHERTTKALLDTRRYSVVNEPGPDVARIRLGITAVDPSVGALNVLLYTKITGAGLGGAALESEITESQSDAQLAASIQWGNGSRVLRAGLTRLGDAKLQINRWVKNLVARLDEAHGEQTKQSLTAATNGR